MIYYLFFVCFGGGGVFRFEDGEDNVGGGVEHEVAALFGEENEVGEKDGESGADEGVLPIILLVK